MGGILTHLQAEEVELTIGFSFHLQAPSPVKQSPVYHIPKLDTTYQYEINSASSPTFANHTDLLSPSSPPHLYNKTHSYHFSPPISPVPTPSNVDAIPTPSQISFSEPARKELRTQPHRLEKVNLNGHEKPLHSEKYEVPDIEVDEPPFEDMACLSILATAFVAKVRELADMRELFCAIEYPECFTGSEAVVSSRPTHPSFFFFFWQTLMVYMLGDHQAAHSQRIFRCCLPESGAVIDENRTATLLSHFLCRKIVKEKKHLQLIQRNLYLG
jgi:hypothetical protein